MKTLCSLLATLVLLVTVGLGPVSTGVALNAANDVPTAAYSIAAVDGDSDGDGQPGSDSYQSWAG